MTVVDRVLTKPWPRKCSCLPLFSLCLGCPVKADSLIFVWFERRRAHVPQTGPQLSAGTPCMRAGRKSCPARTMQTNLRSTVPTGQSPEDARMAPTTRSRRLVPWWLLSQPCLTKQKFVRSPPNCRRRSDEKPNIRGPSIQMSARALVETQIQSTEE